MSPYSFNILPVLRVVKIPTLINMICLVYTSISDPCLSRPRLSQACWHVIEFYRVFSTRNDFLEEYSCGHLTAYILVGERDTNKSFLRICFPCHFEKTIRWNSIHACVKITFEESVFLTLFNMVVNEANVAIFKHCVLFAAPITWPKYYFERSRRSIGRISLEHT